MGPLKERSIKRILTGKAEVWFVCAFWVYRRLYSRLKFFNEIHSHSNSLTHSPHTLSFSLIFISHEFYSVWLNVLRFLTYCRLWNVLWFPWKSQRRMGMLFGMYSPSKESQDRQLCWMYKRRLKFLRSLSRRGTHTLLSLSPSLPLFVSLNTQNKYNNTIEYIYIDFEQFEWFNILWTHHIFFMFDLERWKIRTRHSLSWAINWRCSLICLCNRTNIIHFIDHWQVIKPYHHWRDRDFQRPTHPI